MVVASAACSERAKGPAPAPLSTLPPTSSPVVVLSATPSTDDEEDRLPPVETDNRSRVVVAAGSGLTASASSSYGGWPPSNATDGNIQTSWYSGSNDSAAKGTSPFFQLELREPSTVRRVTILGNRDPSFLRGYTILSGRLDIYDAREHLLFSATSAGTGNRRDFDFRLEAPAPGVKMIRFTSLSDEGDKNPYGDVAIAEIQVE